MTKKFSRLVAGLPGKLDQLLAMDPTKISALPRDLPKRGVYLFSEGDRHLYVGRSDRIPQRLRDHVSNHQGKAVFAFQIARQATGQTEPTYKEKGSRSDLMKDTQFLGHFEAARHRIRSMDVRCVQEDDPAGQCLLEIYNSLTLRTPFNKWDTT